MGLLDQMLRLQQQNTLSLISCFGSGELPVQFNNLRSLRGSSLEELVKTFGSNNYIQEK